MTPQNQLNSRNSSSKTYLFIDTCIIQASGSLKEKEKAKAIRECLQQLGNQGYALVLSHISIYENLSGLWGKKAQQAGQILKLFEWKEISLKVLLLASMLGGLYKSSDMNRRDIEVGDQIIAATAILENGRVLTENHKDFPNPFFVQQRWLPLTYKKNGYNRTADLIIYKPQTEFIKRKIEDLNREN